MVSPKPKEKPPGKSEVGDRIWYARAQLGLSQQAFGERCGLDRVQVVQIERGANKLTSHQLRAAIAKGLAVPLEALSAYLEGELSLVALEKIRLEKSHKLRDIAGEVEKTKLSRLIDRLGLSSESIRILTSADPGELKVLGTLPAHIQRAALAVVHLVDDCNIDEAIVAAQRAYLDLGDGYAGTPQGWISAIIERVHKASRTRPSRPTTGAKRTRS